MGTKLLAPSLATLYMHFIKESTYNVELKARIEKLTV